MEMHSRALQRGFEHFSMGALEGTCTAFQREGFNAITENSGNRRKRAFF